jgi:thiamine-phosphate pyrophosphorylase
MRLRGLYAITDAALAVRGGLEAQVGAALAGGARVVQYRDKGTGTARRENEARALRTLCARFDVPLIINDDIGLAATVGAAGVHLGSGDPAVGAARQRLGGRGIIGVSCYNDFSRALAARSAGADYVAFGSFFASPTKPRAVRASIDLLGRARAELGLPVVAIGGITPENGRQLVAAGADMLAVIHGVFGQSDVEAAARRYASLFESDPKNEE